MKGGLYLQNQKNKIDENFFRVSKINIVLTVIENAGFLLAGYWNLKVLAGSLWGLALTTAFFYSICVSVPKALSYGDSELAQKSIRASRLYRNIMLAIGVVIAMKVPVFNPWAAMIPLLFTRISISVLNFRREEETE